MATFRAPARPAGRAAPTVLALFTLGVGLALLALALDEELAPDAVVVTGWARVVVGAVGAVHALLGARGLVRLFGGRWAEHAGRRPTAAERTRLLAVAGFTDLTGMGLLVVGIVGGIDDAIVLDRWGPPVAIGCGAVLSALGMGLFLLTLRPPPDDLPPGVTGTSWRRPG